MRLLGSRVGLGVAWAHRQATKAEAAQQLPDTSLVQFDIELSRDLLPKINDTPANHAVGLEDRAPSYPLGQRRFLAVEGLCLPRNLSTEIGHIPAAPLQNSVPPRSSTMGLRAPFSTGLPPVAEHCCAAPGTKLTGLHPDGVGRGFRWCKHRNRRGV